MRLPWQGETEGAGSTHALLATEGLVFKMEPMHVAASSIFVQQSNCSDLLGRCITMVYNCPVFSVFPKLILFLFSEVGSCYAAQAGFLRAGIT